MNLSNRTVTAGNAGDRIKGTSEQIADQLRAEIEKGVLSPGSTLNQVLLATRFGLSRIPVREALRKLEAEGYLTYRPNRGATVARALPQDDLLEIIEVRECIELRLMVHALTHMSEDTLRAARHALRRMERAKQIADLRGLHQHFHTILFDAARRPRMTAIVNDWRFRLGDDSQEEAPRLRAFVAATADVHKNLIDALEKADSRALQRCIADEYKIVRAHVTSR